MKQPYEFRIDEFDRTIINPVIGTFCVQLKVSAIIPHENLSDFKTGRIVRLFVEPTFTKETLNEYFEKIGYNHYIARVDNLYPVVKKVIYHDPATIILWDDGTKTVVKCSEGEDYDPEKGFAMCYLKKRLGESEYKKIFKEYVKPYEKEEMEEEK